MTTEIKFEGGAHLLEQVTAEAVAEGQPLTDLEQRCLQCALAGQDHAGLKEVEREFPSPEAYNEFINRSRGLVERALLKEIESRPEMTPQARAALEKFMNRGGEALVGPFLSLAMFGRVPPAVRAFGTLLALVPLAFVAGGLYIFLNNSRLSHSNRFIVQIFLILAIMSALSMVIRFFRKLSGR